MTKIAEPTMGGGGGFLSSSHKKRSWSKFNDGGNNELDMMMMHQHCASNEKPTAHHQQQQQQQQQPDMPDMQTILERYHTLALSHYQQTKRRKLESSLRRAQHTERLQQITQLQQMASDTFNFCTQVLANEERYKKESEREEMEYKKEMERASKEKALAEDFLSKVGMCNLGGISSSKKKNIRAPLIQQKGDMMDSYDDMENNENGDIDGDYRVGGIPARFLDLSHFPKLRPDVHMIRKKQYQDAALGEVRNKKRPIIDCTEEGDFISQQHQRSRATRIPSLCVPQEVDMGSNKMQKKNTKRIYITNASLSHVNGTYLQEGEYNNAPLFVRVGSPRKFWGKYDCNVVLRREKKANHHAVSEEEMEYIWKIGLVPAHRVTHPRIISYFIANEDDCNFVAKIDPMEDDEEVDSFGNCLDPPAHGWRSADNVGAKAASSAKGRASSLKVSYE